MSANRFVPLDLSTAKNVAAPVERSEAASIVGEISERLIELAEVTGEARTQRWVMRLAALCGSPECPRAGWVYLRLCTGNLDELTASHADHAAGMARSKQGEHQEHAHAMRVIGLHFPELAHAIAELEQRKKTKP